MNEGMLYRWVDARAARNYLRQDAMIGRTRHWLPRAVSGLDRLRHKRGLSFAIGLGRWTDTLLPIGFATTRERLDNHVCAIDGHETFLLSDMIDLHNGGVHCGEGIARQMEYAIARSLKDPDEAFVMGDVRGLAERIDHVLVRDDASDVLMRPWCMEHAIEMRRYENGKSIRTC